MKKKYIKPFICDFSMTSLEAQLFSNEYPEGMCMVGSSANSCGSGTGVVGGQEQCISDSTAKFDCITGSAAQGSVCADGASAANQGGQCTYGPSPK